MPNTDLRVLSAGRNGPLVSQIEVDAGTLTVAISPGILEDFFPEFMNSTIFEILNLRT
jgi:hypothetical protein